MNIYTSLFYFKDLTWIMAACYIFLIIGLWQVFAKAGEEGWKALIPFYNFYILFKISDMAPLFWVDLLCLALAGIVYWISRVFFFLYPLGWIFTLASFVLELMMWTNLSKAFGHGMGYALGLTFLNPIFIMVLGFGGSRYWGRPFLH